MLEMLQLLAVTDPFLLGFSVLVFDIPRYTLSLLSLAVFGAWRRSERAHRRTRDPASSGRR